MITMDKLVGQVATMADGAQLPNPEPQTDAGSALSIFGRTAPLYFAKNMPVIPLDPMSKGTRMEGWASYHDRMPDAETQERWLKYYLDGNIGLVLGAQSGIVCIDIDTQEQELVDEILKVLPFSPWCKIGKKGMTLAFRYVGLPSFRIRSKVGGMLVEHLSSRTQTVLPPSIHPDTRRQYVENAPLYEVKDKLQALPIDIQDQLRAIFIKKGIDLSAASAQLSSTVSLGTRDVTLTAHAGNYALFVTKGERSLVDAANGLRALIRSQVESVVGDPVDPEKHVKNMIMFIRRDVLEKGKLLPKGWDIGLTPEQKVELGLDFKEENLEWSGNEIISHLTSEFSKYGIEEQGRMDAIERVFNQMKASKSLSALDIDRVLTFISQAGGMNIKLSTLRRSLKERQKEEITGVNHSQIAQKMIEEMTQTTEVRFHENSFWRWAGSNWEKLAKETVIAMIIRSFGDLPAAKRWSDHNGIYHTMSMLCQGRLSETKTFGVNFANGFLTRDMVLHDHHPTQGMTYTLPYSYKPELADKCPKWMAHLQLIWGDDFDYADKVECLRDLMCVTMFGLGTKMQRAVLLYGLAHTGKSQVIKVMEGLMHPDTVSVCSPKTWSDKFSPSQMLNKLMNICGELGDKEKINGPLFKSIVSGEKIEAQFKNQQTFAMLPIATHWFSSNCIPKSDDDTKGFNRRWIVLTFNKLITLKEKVDDYGERLIDEEREAICAWAMQSASKFQVQTIPTFPKSHTRFIEEMANLHNSVRMFLMDSGLIVGHHPESVLDEAALHQRYWNFCLQGGAGRPVSQKFFRAKAREFTMDLGFEIDMKMNDKKFLEEAHYKGLKFLSA